MTVTRSYAERKPAQRQEAPKQRSEIDSAAESPAVIGASLPSSGASGHPVDLPGAIREKFENAFGTDFSGVRLYQSRAVADAGAEAVTRGETIAFAPGLLDFTGRAGQTLLGHELSHVAARQRGEVSGSGFLNDPALEARADREGAMAAAGQQIAPPTAAMSSVTAAGASGPMQAKKKSNEELAASYGAAVNARQANAHAANPPAGSAPSPRLEDDDAAVDDEPLARVLDSSGDGSTTTTTTTTTTNHTAAAPSPVPEDDDAVKQDPSEAEEEIPPAEEETIPQTSRTPSPVAEDVDAAKQDPSETEEEILSDEEGLGRCTTTPQTAAMKPQTGSAPSKVLADDDDEELDSAEGKKEIPSIEEEAIPQTGRTALDLIGDADDGSAPARPASRGSRWKNRFLKFLKGTGKANAVARSAQGTAASLVGAGNLGTLLTQGRQSYTGVWGQGVSPISTAILGGAGALTGGATFITSYASALKGARNAEIGGSRLDPYADALTAGGGIASATSGALSLASKAIKLSGTITPAAKGFLNLGGKLIPALSIISGGASFGAGGYQGIRGLMRYIRARRQAKKLEESAPGGDISALSEDQQKMLSTMRHGKRIQARNSASGFTKALSGGLSVAAGAVTLGTAGVGVPIGLALGALSAITGAGGGIYNLARSRRIRKNLLADELGGVSYRQAVKDVKRTVGGETKAPISDRRAWKIYLKSHNISDEKAFYADVRKRRAQHMLNKAMHGSASEREMANEFILSMGVKKIDEDNYAEGAEDLLAEKMG